MSTREQLYVETIRTEWRVMSRFQRWLFSRSAPFTAAAARHLAEDDPDYLLADVGPSPCGHRSRIGTHCYRPAGHTGPHIAGFTDRNG